jgi:hypothetical protein
MQIFILASGVFLLKRFLYPDAEVVRTRDPKLYGACDIVIDVGGTYDPGVTYNALPVKQHWHPSMQVDTLVQGVRGGQGVTKAVAGQLTMPNPLTP